MRPHVTPHPRPRTTYALHRWLVPVFFALASFGLAQECSGVTFGGGAGTTENPYLLSTQAHFVSMSDHYESGNASYGCWRASFQMTADVDLSGVDWTPIGHVQGFSSVGSFEGTFDGAEYTIRNLTVLHPDEATIALFRRLLDGGVVERVVLKGARVSASDGAATVVATNSGTIRDVQVHGTVTSANAAGGIVGSAYGGQILNTSFRGAVEAGGGNAGGIVAYAQRSTFGAPEIPRFSRVAVRDDATVVGGASVGGLGGNVIAADVRDAFLDVDVTSDSSQLTSGVGGAFGVVHPNQTGARISVTDLDVRARVRSIDRVGGVVGTAYAGYAIAGFARVVANVDVEADAEVGGLGGYLQAAAFSDARVAGTVVGGDEVGGVVGDAGSGTSFRRVLTSADVEGDSNVGWVAGRTDGATFDAVLADADVQDHPNVFGAVEIEGLESRSTDDLRGWSLYAGLDWPIVTGDPATRGASDPVWRACSGAYPTLVGLGPSVACDPVDTGLTFAFDGASGELLRNVPFDVTLTLRDDAGPVSDGLLDSTIVLSATGGEVPGTLFVAGEDPEALPTATLAAGASSVTFENVVATGLSADAGGDVRLIATGTSGTADGVTASADPASIRDVTMEVTASPTSIRADGSEAATIRVRLAEVADDVGVAGETMTFATDLGTFTDGGAPVGTTVTAETDADGVATARLVADGDAGTATVTVRCPGACPKTVTVEMVGDATSVRAVPGDGKAWLYVGSLGADVVNLEVDRGEGFEALDPPSTASPVRLAGLENGVTYDVRVRGRTEGGGTLPPSDPVSVTPGPVAVPTAPVDVAGDAIEVGSAERRPDGRVALPLTVTVRNDTDVPWTDLWIVTPDAGDAWRIDRAEVEPGRVVRDGDRWNLRFDDAPLAPDATATVTFTLLERE